MAAISEIRIGMSVFSADGSPIGTVHVIGDDRITILGAPGSGYEGGHYHAATVLIATVQDGRILLSNDAEAALILEEAYSEERPRREDMANNSSDTPGEASASGGFDNVPASSGTSTDHNPPGSSRSGPSTATLVGFALVFAIAVSAMSFIFGGRKKSETRLQRGGEGGTTRFGMEDGDDAGIPATGGPASDDGKTGQNA